MFCEETFTPARCQRRYERIKLHLQIRSTLPASKGVGLQPLNNYKNGESDRCSIPGQSTWEMWWANWHWSRFIFCPETVTFAKKKLTDAPTSRIEGAPKFETKI